MHPAKSVIFFTTASGAGYGLAFLLCLLGGPLLEKSALPREGLFLATGFILSLILITAGLLSSTLHLGHPERAWRALSQWRSSWLSREGVAAVFTYLPLTGLTLIAFFGLEISAAARTTLSIIGATACVITVFCTAMIYACLKPVQAWATRLTIVSYLIIALASGGLLLSLILRLFGVSGHALAVSDLIALVALAATYSVKRLYRLRANHLATNPSSTAGSATGLGKLGDVSLLEAPHTEENFLLKEMGFQIARKHAAVLWKLAFGFGIAAPIILLGSAGFFQANLSIPLTGIAVACGIIGLACERWLFFAEAQHTVTLYYGR